MKNTTCTYRLVKSINIKPSRLILWNPKGPQTIAEGQSQPEKNQEKKETETEKIEKAMRELKYQEKIFNQNLLKLKNHKNTTIKKLYKKTMLTYSIIKEKYKNPKKEAELYKLSHRELLELEIRSVKHLNNVCTNTLKKPIKIRDLELVYVNPDNILSALKQMRHTLILDPSFYDAMEMNSDTIAYTLAALTKDYLSEQKFYDIFKEFTDGKDSLKKRSKKLTTNLTKAIEGQDINEEDKKYILKRIKAIS